jgi:beta-carotene/zeaxanthin 4-ketolase
MTARSLSAPLVKESFVSISICAVILLLWLLTAYIGLFVLPDATALPLVGVVLAIALRAFLHTGLFILAHDAMHGTLMPAYPQVNDWAGRIILGIYGMLSYKHLSACHHQHHRTPARASDPDYYAGGFWQWYFKFMQTYLKGTQGTVIFLGMSLLFYPLLFVFSVPLLNVALFWLLPQAISSWQLFYFGTYRPHKRPLGGHVNVHRANSSQALPFWSFLSCYHFDYHWEHHQYPHLPWYKLPSVHQRSH